VFSNEDRSGHNSDQDQSRLVPIRYRGDPFGLGLSQGGVGFRLDASLPYAALVAFSENVQRPV
jgi:hypothetical protein